MTMDKYCTTCISVTDDGCMHMDNLDIVAYKLGIKKEDK